MLFFLTLAGHKAMQGATSGLEPNQPHLWSNNDQTMQHTLIYCIVLQCTCTLQNKIKQLKDNTRESKLKHKQSV